MASVSIFFLPNFKWNSPKHIAIPKSINKHRYTKTVFYLCRMNEKKIELQFQQFPKHIYSFIEFGKEEMSFHFERGKKNISSALQKWKYPHFFRCSKWAICHEQKVGEKKIGYRLKMYAELINFPFISSSTSCRRRHHEYVSFRFDVVWCGLIFVWFTPFNHLLEVKSINWIRHIHRIGMNFTEKCRS